MAMLFALTGLAVWAITLRLARPAGKWTARVMAGLAAAIVLYGGNLHSALYTLLRPLMPATNPAFYFPDSTRFIGFDPPTQDKAFTEFPAYAFAVGDLHAHVLALPVFFLALMVLLAIVSGRAARCCAKQVASLGLWLADGPVREHQFLGRSGFGAGRACRRCNLVEPVQTRRC